MIPAILTMLFAFGLVAFIARPLFGDTRDAGAPATPAERQELDAQVAQALSEIEEIEFDQASGHLSEEDFAHLSDDAKRRALELIRLRDSSTGL